MSDRIQLASPFPLEAADSLWRWLTTPATPNWDDFTDIPQSQFAALLATRRKAHQTWAIRFEEKLVGYVGFRRDSPICGQFQGMVIAPEYRFQHIGREALSKVLAELREAGVEKFLAFVFADNRAVKRIFETCGFAQEGYLTGLTRRDGIPLDVRVLSLPGVAGAREEG
jgi:RimJ/RimL family protein N-acetyltransferase